MLILSHLFLGQRTCISSLGPILRPYYRRWCLRPISRHVGFHPVKDAGERLRFSLSLILNGKIIFLEVRVIGKSSRSIIGGYIYFYLPFNRTNTPLASTTTRMCSLTLHFFFFFFMLLDEAKLRQILMYLKASLPLNLHEELTHGSFCVAILLILAVIWATSTVKRVTNLSPRWWRWRCFWWLTLVQRTSSLKAPYSSRIYLFVTWTHDGESIFSSKNVHPNHEENTEDKSLQTTFTCPLFKNKTSLWESYRSFFWQALSTRCSWL